LLLKYRNLTIRPWQPADRQAIATVISTVLAEYGLGWEPAGADRDVLEIEQYYLATGGAFWTICDQHGQVVGSAGYYPIARGHKAVEIRKMYVLPAYRGQGLGKFVLQELEKAIAAAGWQEIWVETASVLVEAVQLYEKSGYQPSEGVETMRCDRVYFKHISTTFPLPETPSIFT
jgi:putative acetyltransferase